MNTFVGPYSQQIRIVGQAQRPQALAYRSGMSVLDAMIAVGGLTPFASGNRATLIRSVDGKQMTYGLHLSDLLDDGDIKANVQLLKAAGLTHSQN